MSVNNKNKQSSNVAHLRILSDEDRDKVIGNPRVPNVIPGIKQPAQDRLKRLQTNLKKLQDKKPIKEKEKDSKRTTRCLTTPSNTQISATNSTSSSRGIFIIDATPPRKSVGDRLKLQAKKVEVNNRPTTRYPTVSSCTQTSPSISTSNTRGNFIVGTSPPKKFLGLSPKIHKEVNSRSTINAWEKPKALLDASNRLKEGTSQSANQRLSQLRNSLQQAQELNNNDMAKSSEVGIKKIVASSSASAKDPEPMEWEASIDVEPLANKEEVILLMRQASDGEELPNRLFDHMYFVLDTNVLMHNIKFVESLSEVVLPGTVGSMLYIPYIVIKELDKLKSQHHEDDTKRLIAVRAIRYLNKKFDESLEIQAQSAVEEADHQIEVDCPDDSIVNCCLQLRDQVPNMLLVTNDANLRLKANASAIPVSCYSDIKADYPDEFAAIGD
ncbi:uncharacterized protein LOC108117632 isoform X2 [Drosophila eugracilis]|uniref:uncharacterized protein LOC108117632 isoform X2 n=1 Tax=Drosophila eugracilis TaxID=29029 RepID=UPI0007E63531|nr:uncharacterized protein LOC108117632 isoform X2 [Drosophila eugracilis]